MDIINRIWSSLGSRGLSVFIFIMGLTCLLFLAVFGAIIPIWWVNSIATLLPFKVLYILFFINLVICEIKWIPVVIRRCKRPEIPEKEEYCERFRHRSVVRGPWSVASGLEKYLRRRGYKVEGQGEQGPENPSLLAPRSSLLLYAYRGRFSPIGNLLFHLSFLFIAAGVFVSMFYRFEARVLLMEGQEFAGFTAEYGRNAPDMRFNVLDIEPGFWKEKLLFTELFARIEYKGGEDVVRISKAANTNGANITIQGISYTPKYILRNLAGNVLDVGYVNLSNFVPGTEDYFIIPGFPYKIYVSIYPDFEVKEGKAGTKSMNLANPRYLVRVSRGKIPAFSGVLGLKDEVYFDGLALSFPEIKYNGTFQIVRDPGVWLIWAAFILMGTGLLWKLLFYRKEVAVSTFGDKTYLYVNSDYCPALFLNRCAAIIERGLPAC